MKELKAEFELNGEIKRCYFSGIIIEIPCLKCQSTMTRDFGSDYISFANTGINNISMYCDKCDKEYSLDVSIKLESTFTFVESKLNEVL